MCPQVLHPPTYPRQGDPLTLSLPQTPPLLRKLPFLVPLFPLYQGVGELSLAIEESSAWRPCGLTRRAHPFDVLFRGTTGPRSCSTMRTGSRLVAAGAESDQ